MNNQGVIMNPKEWGPKYWKFLHGLIEKIGRCTSLKKLQEDDEARYVLQILNAVLLSMPCLSCRKHYKEWLLLYPLRHFSKLRRAALREALRKWLWGLHSDVNMRNKVSVQPALEDLEGIYSSVNIKDALNDIPILSPEMKEVRRISYLLFSLLII